MPARTRSASQVCAAARGSRAATAPCCRGSGKGVLSTGETVLPSGICHITIGSAHAPVVVAQEAQVVGEVDRGPPRAATLVPFDHRPRTPTSRSLTSVNAERRSSRVRWTR